MLLKQLQYFVSVVEEKSFTEAAEKHYISQSAVSQAIRALERDIGVRLLTRKNRTFVLTASGEAFYRKARRLLADLDKAVREAQRIGEESGCDLCIAYLNVYTGPELLDTVAQFSAAYPEVSLSTFSGTHEEIYHGLISGSIHIALSDQRRAFNDDYMNVELVRAECMVEIAQRHLRGSIDTLDVSTVPELPCILIATQEYQENEAAYFQEVLGLKSDFIFAKSMEEARLMVTSGRGFLPVDALGALPAPARGVCRLPLYRGQRQLTRRYCLFWEKARSTRSIETFAALLQKKLSPCAAPQDP